MTDPVAEAGPGRTTTPRPAPSGPPPIPLALASSALLWSSFPPAEWSGMAWLALIPFFLLARSDRPAWSIYLAATLGGFAFWLLALNWIGGIDPSAWLAWVVMAAVLAAWWPMALLLTRIGTRKLALPLMLAGPIAWVALEYVRAHILSGFPWYYLAHSQYRFAHLIQYADFAGSLGISFLVAAANACGADLLARPLLRPTPDGPRLARGQVLRLGTLAVALVSALFYGAYRLGTANFRPGPTIALLQSDLLQRYKKGLGADKLLELYAGLSNRAVRAATLPDLIVWPETSFPYHFVDIDPSLPQAELLRQFKDASEKFTSKDWYDLRSSIAAELHAWADRLRVPMVVGINNDAFRPGGHAQYNAALLVRPKSAAFESYRKLQLVPFGEYVPLINTFPWLTALTPYRTGNAPGLAPGEKLAWFDVGPYRYAAVICFEDTVPQVYRRAFAEAPEGRHPDVMLNLTNDGWFRETSEQEMHLAISVFRAIENRAPLARAVNTGISALIDGNGRIVARQPRATEGVLTVSAPLDDRVGLYSAWGDWLGRSCLAVAIGVVPIAVGRDLRRRRRERRKLSIPPDLPEVR